MRKLFAIIVGILASLYTIDSSAQSIRDVFTICAGETVTFPVPTNGGGGPGACSPVLTDIRLEESATGLSIDANGITLQPNFGIYTVVGRGSCIYLDPITGISSVFNAEVKWRYEVQPSTNCQEEERADALFVDFPWLSDLVDRNNCTTEKIEVYISGIYIYLLVTEANGTAKLYNQDGQFYCQNAANFDCTVAYGFGPPIQPATWTCGASNPTEDCLPEEQLIQSLRGGTGSSCLIVTKISKIEYNGATYYRNVIGRNPNVATPCGVQENFGKAINCRGQDVCLFALIAPPPNYDPEVCNAIQTELGTETVLFPEEENICSAEETINELKTSSTASSCYAVTRINQVDYNGTSYFRTHVGRTIASFQPNVVSCGIRSDFGATFDCDGRKICDFAATIPPPDYDPATCDALVPVPDRIVWQDEENTCSIGDPLTLPFIATIINNTGEEVCERVKNITQIGFEGFTFFRLNSEAVISTVNCVALAPTDIFLDCKGNTVGTIGGINNCPPGSACADLVNASGNTIWTREDPPIDNTCSVEGRVFFENCDDGKLFFFIRTVDGRVFDPYLGDGVSFDFEEGQSVKFSYEAANFSSPCSIAEQAIILNCIEITGSGETHDEIFTRYEWLTDLVDQTNCEGIVISEYEQGVFNFIAIRQGASLKLYFQDGTFYCENSANYECISAYKLGAPINSWECTGGSDGCAYAELIRLNPCDPEVIETALYEYNGSTYIVTIPDPSLIDAGPVVRNCSDGSVFCTISFFAISGTCNDFFDTATKLEVLASRADCSTCSEIAVGGGLREIVISNLRAAASPLEAIDIQSVQYINKTTRIAQSAQLCSESICPIQPGETLTIPVEFENGNNEFEVRVTFKGGLSCLYDVTLVGIEDCICTAVYMPVCGVDGKTYSNACRAFCAGVDVVSEGECGGNNNRVFDEFQWLNDLVDVNNCTSEKVEIYQSGVYKYLLVTDANGTAILYNDQGQFYCQNAANYDCVAAYNLGSPIDVWTCDPNSPSEVCDLLTVINIAPCAPTIQEMAVYEYRGKQYLVTEPTTDTGIQDLEISALDCKTGELFCAEGELLASNPDLLLCGLFLQEATKGFVVYNRERDCPDACPQEDCSLTTLPEEFGLFTIIYSVCEGDTLTVPNPSRSFLCNNPGGPAPPIGTPQPVDVIPQVLNFTPVWESRGENAFSTSGSTISFFPKETTEFIGYWPNVSCSGGVSPANGRPVHYLVIVNEGVGCQTTASPTFLIEACVGEVVTIPSPVIPSVNGATACPGNRQFIGGTTAELVEPIFSFTKDLQVRIQSEGSFQVEAMGGSGNYSTNNDVISCPELTYNFQVRLLDCPDFCAGVTPDPVCGVDGNTYSSACEAEQAGVAVAAQGECGGNCSNTGTIFFEHCDDGRLFYFLRTSDGRVYDPYFDTGITYEPVDGQQIRFDFVDAAFSSPCTNAEKAITLTCLEIIEDTNETSSEGTIGEEEFKKYPFLRNAISQNGCTTIEIYDQGSYDFVFLRTSSTSGKLYLDNGTFYCGSTPTYDCISAYGLSAPTTVFTCSNFDAPEREDRARQFKPEGLTVYPNPTIGALTIQLPLTAADSYELYLHDLFGRTVHQEVTTPDATSINIDMSEYKDGVYYIELRTAGRRGIQKVVKQGLE